MDEYLKENFGKTTKKDIEVKPNDKITEVMDEYLKQNFGKTTKKI